MSLPKQSEACSGGSPPYRQAFASVSADEVDAGERGRVLQDEPIPMELSQFLSSGGSEKPLARHSRVKEKSV